MQGISLIEQLVVVTIAGVIASLAIPSFTDWQRRERSVAVLNQMVGAVGYARNSAASLRVIVTMCPGSNGECGSRNSWHRGTVIFADHNRNGRRESSEPLLTELPALRSDERITWRSFRNRSVLQMTPTGLTNWQNGSFQYCPGDGSAEGARMVILNTAGRARSARDNDEDGVVEDAQGRPLRC
ncbi:MAG: GspH/FimT family pseudopilin [Pseudomonadaceae bacterium]|nr:GspH/FimT family pseudopilin [Pseudomonadaceae bacterium]